jgi:hypothetical protein
VSRENEDLRAKPVLKDLRVSRENEDLRVKLDLRAKPVLKALVVLPVPLVPQLFIISLECHQINR